MLSQARSTFKANSQDIHRLLEFHKPQQNGTPTKRRAKLEVLNKSAILLLTSIWEAFCEDTVTEALHTIVTRAPSLQKLPLNLRKLLAIELHTTPAELSRWNLSDTHWRVILRHRLSSLQTELSRQWSTPNSANIDKLFQTTLGITALSSHWKWLHTTPDQARKTLDHYVNLRGAIAHRGTTHSAVTKTQVIAYQRHINHLARCINTTLAAHLRTTLKKSP